MNPWASLLAQFAAQALASEGPILIQDLEGALNGVLTRHGHSVAITPVAAPPQPDAGRPSSKDNPPG